jgi:hypothetical protein
MQPEWHDADTLLRGPIKNNKTMDAENTAVEGRKRIDPLKTIVDYDLVKMAADLHGLKQNREYWETVPVPKRPDGELRHESLLQVGVFALPVIVYVAVAQHFGYGHALYGLPLYYGVFRLLERALSRAILSKRQKEEDLDRGRYAFTKILGDRLSLKSEEVTYERLLKMVGDFGLNGIFGRNMPMEKKNAILRRVNEIKDVQERLDYVIDCYERTKQYAPAVQKKEPAAGARSTNATATAAAAAAAASEDDDVSPFPVVNTMTGLPMIQGTPYDVGGNVLGQGTVGGFE